MNIPHARQIWLIIGDILAILVVTVAGFLNHYGHLEGWRWLSSFVPVLASWLIFSPWFGVYREPDSGQLKQVWRPALAAFLAAPLAATLRGLWLNAAILPVFVLVLGATNALGLLLWRVLWTGLVKWTVKHG